VRFDDNLIYGHEELDISMYAVIQCGYRIVQLPEAINEHYPSKINRDYYKPFFEASRLYITFKQYTWLEKKPVKGAAYIVIAMAHSLLHSIKAGHGLKGFSGTAKTTFSYIGRYRRTRSLPLAPRLRAPNAQTASVRAAD
jgi:hypothetical protein